MCLAPCYRGCTDERYAEEAQAVERFLATRGQSRLVELRAERDEASARLEFETAAALHAQAARVESVRALAPELVRPLGELRAAILQASAEPDAVAVFLYENGRLRGPAAFSTLGMRIQNEQSGSTSLFAQPVMMEPVPETVVSGQRTENGDGGTERQGLGNREQGIESGGYDAMEAQVGDVGVRAPARAKIPRGVLEARMESALAVLAEPSGALSATVRQGHLALLKRWYYRPEARRPGEIFFPDAEGRWPVKSMLRGVGRVAARSLVSGSAAE